MKNIKTKTHILFLFIGLTITSCSTASKISKQSNQNKSLCKDLVWYNFIGGKPDKYHLDSAQKVAERWGFKIVYELGSGANSEEERKKNNISEEKSTALFECLVNTIGENWKSKFNEEVKT